MPSFAKVSEEEKEKLDPMATRIRKNSQVLLANFASNKVAQFEKTKFS